LDLGCSNLEENLSKIVATTSPLLASYWIRLPQVLHVSEAPELYIRTSKEKFMPGELIPIIIVPAFLLMLVWLTKIISDNRIRRLLVDKEVSGDIIEKVFLSARAPDIESNLKWGLVCVFIGLAFATISIANLDADEPMTYAALFIFGGGGLLVFYALKQLRGEQ